MNNKIQCDNIYCFFVNRKSQHERLLHKKITYKYEHTISKAQVNELIIKIDKLLDKQSN